jgi:hypothetical protein
MSTWTEVPIYPGYWVDHSGNVKGIHGKVLTPWRQKRGGYPAVKIRSNGHSKTVCVHTLVLLTFYGPPPTGHEACHRNGDPTDNRSSNLYWGTRTDNVRDMLSHGTYAKTHPTHRGSLHHEAKLSEADVVSIRARYVKGTNQHNPGNLKQLAIEYGVDYTTAWAAATGRKWTHV